MWQKFSKTSSKSAKDTSWKALGYPIKFGVAILSVLAGASLLTGVAAANVDESNITKSALSKGKAIDPAKTQQIVQDTLNAYGGEHKFKQVYEKGCHGFGKYTQISSLSGAEASTRMFVCKIGVATFLFISSTETSLFSSFFSVLSVNNALISPFVISFTVLENSPNKLCRTSIAFFKGIPF